MPSSDSVPPDEHHGAGKRRFIPRWLTITVQIGVSAGLLAALVAVADWDTLRSTADALSAWLLAMLVMLALAAQAALVLRWRALLEMLSIRESWRLSWHSVFAGLFLTNFLPGTLGSDGLRIVLLTKSCGRASTAVGAIAYERLMQLALYLLLMWIAALAPMGWLPPLWRSAIILGGAIVLALMILVLYWLGQRRSDVTAERAGLLQSAWRLLATILVETGRMQTRMRRHRRAAIGFWASSILNVALILAIWWVVLSSVGDRLDIQAIALSVGAAAIASAIPISLGGIGVYEAMAVLFLGLNGVSSSHALLLALVIRAVFLVGSIAGLPSAVTLWRNMRS